MQNKDYTVLELAKRLGISRVAVFKKIKTGRLMARRLGRKFIIAAEDAEELFEAKDLSENKKEEIKGVVNKAVAEYGETFKLLGKE